MREALFNQILSSGEVRGETGEGDTEKERYRDTARSSDLGVSVSCRQDRL